MCNDKQKFKSLQMWMEQTCLGADESVFKAGCAVQIRLCREKKCYAIRVLLHACPWPIKKVSY